MTTRQPRIAILTPFTPPDSRGGVEVFNEQLRQTFPEVDVLTGPMSAEARSPWHWGRLGLDHPRRALGAVREAIRAHRMNPYDAILCNGLYGWPLALRKLDVLMVQVYHVTLAGLAKSGIDHPGDRFATGTISALFDRLSGVGKLVVAVSHNVLLEVRRFYRLDGTVVPNGVDTDRFRAGNKTHAREALGLPQSATIGLYVGRPERVKGFDLVMAVSRLMRDVLFLHVGSAPRAWGPNLRGIGNVSHPEMPTVYTAADFYFLPSRYEGFNLSILEALACGLPIVVSRAAYPFLEGPERYGKVVDSFAPSQFAGAIRDLLPRLSSYDPRPVIEADYSLRAFRARWRQIVQGSVGHSTNAVD